MKDDSVWSGSIFVASAEAYEAADFFLLKDLKKAIALGLMTDISELIAMFQKTPFCQETLHEQCRDLYGKPIAELIRDFFAGVHLVYSARYDNNYLRETYIEFSVHCSLAFLQYPEYIEGLRRETEFSTDVLIATSYGHGISREWEWTGKCMACNEGLPQNGRHIARSVFGDSEGKIICSKCFSGWIYTEV